MPGSTVELARERGLVASVQVVKEEEAVRPCIGAVVLLAGRVELLEDNDGNEMRILNLFRVVKNLHVREGEVARVVPLLSE